MTESSQESGEGAESGIGSGFLAKRGVGSASGVFEKRVGERMNLKEKGPLYSHPLLDGF